MSSLIFFPWSVWLEFLKLYWSSQRTSFWSNEFSLLFFYSTDFHFDPYYFLSFAYFGFDQSFSFSSLRWRLRSLIWGLSFLIQGFRAMNIPHSPALETSHKFWCVVFSFSIKYFTISLLISYLIHGLFRSTLVSKYLGTFPEMVLISNSIPCGLWFEYF